MDSDAEDFLEGMESVGIPPERLRAILLTHWHNDHSTGAAFLKSKFGLRVYYAAGDQPFLTRQTATQGIRGWLGKHVPEEGVLVLLRGLREEAAPKAVAAHRLVSDGEIIGDGFRVYWPRPVTQTDMLRMCMSQRAPCSVAMLWQW
jgi:glyoxylase-like metal-dependent hydrolase (beta-lactamase superfamily II)